MLIVFGGLPGVGKTTISRLIATRRDAAYLRIDSIEQALRNALVLAGDVGTAGYDVAIALAADNLACGRHVVADCVNPVAESRQAWRDVAARAGARLVEIEVICPDPAEHRRRVEARVPDIAGLKPPAWPDVVQRHYEPWTAPHLVVDTSALTPDEAAALVERHIDA